MYLIRIARTALSGLRVACKRAAEMAPPAYAWCRHQVTSTLRLIKSVLADYLRLDAISVALIALFLLLYAPLIPRNTENPRLMAAYVNDEPFLVMALEATTVFPYGNPANYFDTSRSTYHEVPDYWGSKRYPTIFYYGGAMYQLTFPVYAALRIAGLPAFPTGPILLRSLMLISAALGFLILYNLGRIRGWRIAGAFAVLYLIIDPSYTYYVAYTHPDVLQMLFGLCAFLFAVYHSKNGDLRSLTALGLFCGFVQGTKVGGPWIAPMGLLAAWLGLKHAMGPAHQWTEKLKVFLFNRSVILGAVAILGFIISTPYAILDSYYFLSLINTFKIVSSSYLNSPEPVTLLSWTQMIHTKYGWLGVAVICATILKCVWVNRSGVRDPALLLAVVLSLTQLVWFGSTSKVWIVWGYLILSFGLMYYFGFETICSAVDRLIDRLGDRFKKLFWPVVALTAFCLFVNAHWYLTLRGVLDLHLSRYGTVKAANQWAKDANLPAETAIVYDDLAYFDPSYFKNANMHGGVLTPLAVEHYDPKYIVLSSSLFGAAWMQNLIKTQDLDPEDRNQLNVRLYQELLSATKPGATDNPEIELVKVIKASSFPPRSAGADILARLKTVIHGTDEPVVGPELRIFKRTPSSP